MKRWSETFGRATRWTVAVTIFVGACAIAPRNVPTIREMEGRFEAYTCNELTSELDDVLDDLEFYERRQRREHTKDVSAIVLSILFTPLWLLLMLPDQEFEEQIGRLRGWVDALEDELAERC